ncbi:MAG TPA: hypothetical protein PKM57_15120 [Kiritimatiellia bacterium]|nr:hypothetical protein [Kiritimatiellia bacterium]HPS08320.1 hypothetical protein [Kiritimatiellia bacterium]
MRRLFVLLGMVAVFANGGTSAEVRFDFERGDLQGWQVLDGGFGKVVSDRAKEHHGGAPYTKEGTWFLSTLESADGLHPDDRFEGVVESPVVVLSAPDITLLVGGGAGPDVYVALCTFEGNEVAYARGGNGQRLLRRNWSVPELVGKPVFFRVADRATGGWGHITLDSLVCQGAVDAAASAQRFRARKREIARANGGSSADRLRAAVQELGQQFGARYPQSALLAKLDALESGDDAEALETFAREALVRSNPLLTGQPILFVARKQYRPDHHNTETMFQTGEVNTGSYDTEGAFKLLDVQSGAVRTLFAPGTNATVRDPDVSFDAKRIVFSMRKSREDDYHIYAMRADGTEVRQLTSDPGVSDIDPIWLPDGDLLFSASREPKYCMCNRHIMCNLYRMEPDGANIHQIGKSTLFEGHATLMPDGRILYDRWEYVDRNFGDAQGLWVCNPDGTGHGLYWGNNTTSPGGVIDARTLSKAHLAIAVLGACHDRPWGALGLIDRSRGVDGREPVLRTWPDSFVNRIKTEGQDFDSSKSIARKYEDPYPLDDRHFLCSRQTGNGEEMALYYLDLHGNEVVVHAEAPGCYDPMPLRARLMPPVIPCRRNFERPDAAGTFYVQNAYVGTHMRGVKPGAIKYLRVVESPEKRNWSDREWFGQGAQAPGMNWHNFENKRILGTVPVEDDGSAYFEVPANTFVFFQALDENGMMVQSMRSGVYVQPGETYGCVGCHENRVGDIPPVAATPKAMKRKPDPLKGWYGAPRLFSFQKEVQPVFDRHCVSCHDYGKKAGGKLNLAGDRDAVFCASYVDLWSQGAITCVGGGPAEIQQAYSWGSHPSKLIQKVRAGHADVRLSLEELDRLITWVDLNAPYYPHYECAYPQNLGGRCPLTKDELNRLKVLTGVQVANSHSAKQRATMSFARPEVSRILLPVASNATVRAEALELIVEGARRLKERPRADMDGFVPVEQDRARESKYQARRAEERRVYDAIRNGKKLYDGE